MLPFRKPLKGCVFKMDHKVAYSPVWTENFTVRSFDIGLCARMRLSNLCSYLQEAAGRHATHLDAGYRYMQETGRVWVLSRLFMNINGFPEWNREFTVETWPMGLERIFFRREYRVCSANKVLITASSHWLLLDIKTRRPGLFNINEDVLKANEGKYSMQIPSDGFARVDSAVKSVHKVVYSDLDQNRHANNARYVAWILDCLDAEFHEKYVPAWFAIEYKHEVREGDTVELLMAQVDKENPAFNIEGRIEATGRVCLRSVIRFAPATI